MSSPAVSPSYEEIDEPHIVIDNGSYKIRASFSGETQPRIDFQNITGEVNRVGVQRTAYSSDCAKYIGDDAELMGSVANWSHPVSQGIVTDWDDMVKVWRYTFKNKLRVDPSEHNVLLTESPDNPKNSREKTCTIMFEEFGVNGMYLSNEAVLSLYASARTTGTVLNCGYSVTHAVSVYEGYALSHANEKSNVAGSDVTDYLLMKMNENPLFLDGHVKKNTKRKIARDIKEKACCVARNAEELEKPKEAFGEYLYELPDGQTLAMGKERLECPEVLFNPKLIRKTDRKIDELIYTSIAKCDIDLRKSLYGNIVLSGETSMLPGIGERLKEELSQNSYNRQVKVEAGEKNRAWLGGSIISGLSTFDDLWITKDEYWDCGSNLVQRRCF